MKYRVKIEEQWFEVEIENPRARPVVAQVEGETFEVWPASELPPQPAQEPVAKPVSVSPPPATVPEPPAASATPAECANAACAPIPGVIISIAVQPGDAVQVGQELCVLEAMKMNNTIRAARAGTVARVNVSVGQHVKHGEVLLEYTE
jgi:propionyl-CoA carboxylase alpha chain